ncbi:MAG: tetratricopeptide repeat protein, partial [Hormoscilla sp. SP12CHS1]|nr:tetratricopeptide repeat protein [Hormoscilla sp. SP12CHS1]
KGAIADSNKAIEIKPDYAEPYVTRGVARGNLGDYKGAIADMQTAAQKFHAQGDMDMYQKAQELLRQFQQQ